MANAIATTCATREFGDCLAIDADNNNKCDVLIANAAIMTQRHQHTITCTNTSSGIHQCPICCNRVCVKDVFESP